MFSILILTHNEKQNLPGCLESISWCDDIVVLDSYSTDGTLEIGRDAGVRIFQRKFDDFAGQRNHALNNIDYKYPWVFHLDADEHFTDELRAECSEVILADEHSGFLVPSKMMWRKKWLKYAGTYPAYQMRLMKIGEVRFVQIGHGQRESQAERGMGMLSSPYLHYFVSKGLHDWIKRHRRYAEQEAAQNLKELEEKRIDWAGLRSRESIRRRRALQGLSFRLPGQPLLRFLYVYILRFGFLDGTSGLVYCVVQFYYANLIRRKIRELRRGV